nr:MAG TPA: hypothetical protein [Crassvirales sp.]
MKSKCISITLEQAKEWYYGDSYILQELALKAFDREELKHSFKDIKSFKDACDVLELDYDDLDSVIANMIIFGRSRASAAIFKLNIIRKALNLGQDLSLTKNPKGSSIYYPYTPLVISTSTCYNSEVSAGQKEVIGIVKIEGTLYSILGGTAYHSAQKGLGCFYSEFGVNLANSDFAFLGCATKEIAEHFGIYFGALITEAKFGDLPDFHIITSKYN